MTGGATAAIWANCGKLSVNLFISGISASMLSYRHSFHAGNHADVLKHTVQSLIIESLKEKEKPFLYLDTHAGAGRYQLSGEHAERTGEYLEGIARIWQQDDLPTELEPYISVVEHFNRSGQLRYYLVRRLSPASCCASRTACR